MRKLAVMIAQIVAPTGTRLYRRLLISGGTFVFMGLLLAEVCLAQSPSNSDPIRFVAVDIFVNSGSEPLAAYQLEFSALNSNAKIVGIEGGDHAAFKDAPFYDTLAMQHERVIIAAFSTATDLPVAQTRVATIHLQLTGTAAPQYQLALQAAGNAEGQRINAAATCSERTAQ